MRLLNDGQGPVAEIARKRGLPRNRSYKWQKEVALHGDACPGSNGQAGSAAKLDPLRCEARDAKKGLWADPHPVPPWDYRKARRGHTLDLSEVEPLDARNSRKSYAKPDNQLFRLGCLFNDSHNNSIDCNDHIISSCLWKFGKEVHFDWDR